jgi:hypothetical protein
MKRKYIAEEASARQQRVSQAATDADAVSQKSPD